MCRRLGHVLRRSESLFSNLILSPEKRAAPPSDTTVLFRIARVYRPSIAYTHTHTLIPTPCPPFPRRANAARREFKAREQERVRELPVERFNEAAAFRGGEVRAGRSLRLGGLLMTPESTAEVCFRVLEQRLESDRGERDRLFSRLKPFRKQPPIQFRPSLPLFHGLNEDVASNSSKNLRGKNFVREKGFEFKKRGVLRRCTDSAPVKVRYTLLIGVNNRK